MFYQKHQMQVMPSPYLYVLCWNIIVAVCLYGYWHRAIGQYSVHQVAFTVQDYKIETGSCDHWESSGCFTASLVGTIVVHNRFEVNSTILVPFLSGIRQARSYIEHRMMESYVKDTTIQVHATKDYSHGVTDIDSVYVWMIITIFILFNLCMTGDTIRNYRKHGRRVINTRALFV